MLQISALRNFVGFDRTIAVALFTYSLGDAVRKLREKKGYTLRELASVASVAYTAIGRIENGAMNFDHATIERIAKSLDTDVPTLLAHADPLFVTPEQRELLTLFDGLDPRRKQILVTVARREHEALRRADHAPDAATDQDQPKKATG
jgi:transcriptional regulator with XRE-family HTH domain